MGAGSIQDKFPSCLDASIIRATQSATVKRIIKEELPEEYDLAAEKKGLNPDFMMMLAKSNEPYCLLSPEGTYSEPLNNLDCLIIYQKLKKIK